MRKKALGVLLLSATMTCSQFSGVAALAAQKGTSLRNVEVSVKKAGMSKKKLKKSVRQSIGKMKALNTGKVIASFVTEKQLSKNSLVFPKSTGISVQDVWGFGKKGNGYYTVACFKSDTLSTKELMNKVKKEMGASSVMPDREYHIDSVSDDSLSKEQWALSNTGQDKGVPGYDIAIEKAWQDERYQKFEKDDSKEAPVVAVMDTGFDFTNPDLKDMAWDNHHMATLRGKHGYNFTEGIDYYYKQMLGLTTDDDEDDSDKDKLLTETENLPQDNNGHGSHVSGIIAAAVNNKLGIAGENKKVKIMPVKALDMFGYGDDASFLSSFNYIYKAKKMGVNVVAVNCSWGGAMIDGQTNVYKNVIDALGKLGVITVVSAGNDGIDIDKKENIFNIEGLPRVDSKYLISVGAMDADGKLASYSSYGKKLVDIAAPGTDILSTVSYPCFNPTIYSEQKKKEVCDYYQGFDGDEKNQNAYIAKPKVNGYPEEMDMLKANNYLKDFDEDLSLSAGATATTSLKEDQFATNKSKAVNIDIQKAKTGDCYAVAFPYEVKENSTVKAKNSISLLVRGKAQYDKKKNESGYMGFVLDAPVKEDGTIDLTKAEMADGLLGDSESGFMHSMLERTKKVKKGDKRAVVVLICAECDMNAQISIDDVAVSKPMDKKMQADQFGKYDYYSGTSMAAPYVTGAVAVLRSMYPDMSTEKLRNTVCGMSKKSDLLEGKTANSSYLTYDKLDVFQPTIASMEMKNGELVLTGDYFGNDKGKIFVNDQEVSANDLKWSDNKVVVDGVVDLDQDLAVRLEAANGSMTKIDFVYSAEKQCTDLGTSKTIKCDQNTFWTDEDYSMYTSGMLGSIFGNAGKMCTDGNEMYYVTEDDLGVYQYKKPVSSNGKGTMKKDWQEIGSFNLKDFYDKEDTLAGKYNMDSFEQNVSPVYCNGKIYTIIKFGKEYSSNYKLIGYDLKSNKWQVIGDLPKGDDRDNLSGYSLGVFNGQLYLVGGYDAYNDKLVRDVYSYDTTKKTVSWKKEADLPSGRKYVRLCQSGKKLFAVLGGNEDETVPKTCVYDGTKWTEVGEDLQILSGDHIFEREFAGESTLYGASVGAVKGGIIISDITAKGLGNIFTLTEDEDGSYHYHATDYALENEIGSNGMSPTAISVKNAYYILRSDNFGMAKLLSMPIEDANNKIIDQSDKKKAEVSGAGEYAYGQTAQLSAKAIDKNYVVKEFVVDGKKYKANAVIKVKVTKDLKVKAVVKKKPVEKKKSAAKKTNSKKK